MRFALILVFFIMSGCMTMKPVDLDVDRGELVSNIDIGKKVEVQTFSNEKYVFTVSEITKTELVGDSYRVPLNEIKELKNEKISVVQTSGAVAAGVVVAEWVMVMMLLAVLF